MNKNISKMNLHRKIHQTKCKICNKKMQGIITKVFCSVKCSQRNKHHSIVGQKLAQKTDNLSPKQERLNHFIINNDLTNLTYVDISLATHLSVNEIIKSIEIIKVKMTKNRQKKYTQSAKDQECQIRTPFCNNNRDTVVFCHLNSGGGMGQKTNNIHGAYGCCACHDAVDGRTPVDLNSDQLKFYHLQGVIRTQNLMIENGILKL